MPRLRRADCSEPGVRRRGRGRGFEYRDRNGDAIRDPDALARIGDLSIPPAWRDVWICPDPLGHLQATGIDSAGRKQYLYHPRWREHRDRRKFDDMVEFARALPRLRRRVARDLAGDELRRERVLACAVRLLDRGLFRTGGEAYVDANGSYGLATILKRHVRARRDGLIFDYPAKGGVRRVQMVADADVAAIVRDLKGRRGGSSQLLAYRDAESWRDVRSDDINDYVREASRHDCSAKDFRTWNGTVLAAVALAKLASHARGSKTARNRAIREATKEVARQLGNTPAVCRRSYIDPRVFDRFGPDWTLEVTVVDGNGLLDDDRARARLERTVLALLE
jgi:DNA topoisomerase-1